jgi:hypothetical protein
MGDVAGARDSYRKATGGARVRARLHVGGSYLGNLWTAAAQTAFQRAVDLEPEADRDLLATHRAQGTSSRPRRNTAAPPSSTRRPATAISSVVT